MKTLIRKFSVSTLVCSITFLSSFSNAFAEDIEIYNRTQTVPNVLFIVDTSESMKHQVGGKSRMQHLKDALATVLGDNYSTLNVGMMNLGYWDGSGIDFPITDINTPVKPIESGVASATETVGQFLTRLSGGYEEKGITPTVDTYYEAMRYFRGENVHRGKFRPGPWDDARNYYANDQLGSKNANEVGYPIPGPTPISQAYHRNAANPLSYTGGSWDPNAELPGQNCWTNAFGAGNPPGGTQCVPANVFQPAPFTSNCARVDPTPAGTPYQSCPEDQTRSCLVYSESGTNTKANNNDECATWGPYSCPVATVTVTPPARQGFYRCQHKRYGQFVGTPTYTSPINTACTANYVIMLTDGAPSKNVSKDDATLIMTNGSSSDYASYCSDLASEGITNPAILNHGLCGPDIAEFLATQDQSTSQTGDQFVNTYTVGIQLPTGSDTRTYLELLANKGNGAYIDAANPATLVSDLQSIVSAITQKSRTIARVGNTLDLSTLGSSRDEVYVPMFTAEPNQPRWPGNLKGYTLDPTGVLVGLDSSPVFTTAGEFSASSRSYWSSSADGGDVSLGGVAGLLNPATRNVNTDDGPGTSRTLQSLDSANSALTGDPALFGLAGATSTALMQEHINWARGVDVDDEDVDGSTSDARNYIGDALHSDPIIANYTGSIERVAYFMTNEGYLHAIDVTGNTSVTGGNELFAYMPSDLLPNLDALRKNIAGPKVYGLDGPLTLFQMGGPTNTAGNKYLFFGMRRGGMNYYAMDVTDPTAPSLMWVIEGGSGDFQELGQSWSEPIVSNVNVGGTPTLALVIGGGYDTTQDAATTYTPDSMGRAVYVVDAVTGAKIWSAGPSGSPDSHDLTLPLANGIAGDVSVIDFDNDTVVDRLYFGDTGGDLWRIDLQGNLDGTAGFAADFSGYKLASLHGTATNDNRRFFARPVVALTPNGKLAIAVGSGHRPHPLDPSVQDRFYVLYDPNGSGVPTSAPSPITDSDLQDLTGFTAGFDSSSTTVGGWRIDLDIAGEKVFNTASILRGEVFFSTYYPPAQACSNTPDGSRLFVLDLEGNPTRDLDSSVTGLEPYVSTLNFGIVSEFTLHYSRHDGNVRGINLPNVQNVYSTNSLFDRFWTNNP